MFLLPPNPKSHHGMLPCMVPGQCRTRPREHYHQHQCQDVRDKSHNKYLCCQVKCSNSWMSAHCTPTNTQMSHCHSTKYVQFLLLIVISFYSTFINVLFDSQMNNVICKANELWVWEGYSYLTNKETLAALPNQ